MKIYTKTGDLGKTSLIGGTRVPKSHIRIESYGTVDELNSYIGFANDHIQDSKSRDMLKEIQDRLFTIGSSLACDPEKEPMLRIPDLKEEDIEYLSEEQVKSLITRLLFEIEKLKDENESLWYMLEEIEQSNIAGREAIAESLKSLKNFKTAINAKPAEA